MPRKYAAMEADIRKVKADLEAKARSNSGVEAKYNHEAIDALGTALQKIDMSGLVSGDSEASVITPAATTEE